jgi:hypothetical protein
MSQGREPSAAAVGRRAEEEKDPFRQPGLGHGLSCQGEQHGVASCFNLYPTITRSKLADPCSGPGSGAAIPINGPRCPSDTLCPSRLLTAHRNEGARNPFSLAPWCLHSYTLKLKAGALSAADSIFGHSEQISSDLTSDQVASRTRGLIRKPTRPTLLATGSTRCRLVSSLNSSSTGQDG